MYVLQSEIETLLEFVIVELRRREIVLKEKSRQALIGKAIKVWRESNGDYSLVLVTLETEIVMLAAMTNDKNYTFHTEVIIDICTDCQWIVSDKGAAIQEYLNTIGLRLRHDTNGYYVRVPRSYETGTIKRKLKKILDNRR